jgi:hypothetical protein
LGGVTAEQLIRERNKDMREGWRRGYNEGVEDGLHEAAIPGAEDEIGFSYPDGSIGAYGYRTAQRAKRDLSSASQEKAIAAVYRLWNTHPIAKALTEIMVDYVVGDGVEFHSTHEEIQEVLDDFVKDPVNKLDGEGLDSLVRELGLFGEQVVLTFVKSGRDVGGTASGLVRLGTLDPSDIDAILTDPDNIQDVIAIKTKEDVGEGGPKIYKVIKMERRGEPYRGSENLAKYAELVAKAGEREERLSEAMVATIDETIPTNLKTFKVSEGAEGKISNDLIKEAEIEEGSKYDGQCFLFQVNKMRNGKRGRPDLLPSIDWLDRFDQLFFDGAEHIALLNMYAWHLTVEGGSEDSPDPESNLRTQLKKVTDMQPNSAFATNERVQLEPLNPELRTADLETIIRQLRLFITGGSRVPEHWVSEGGYTNRSTAESMGQPTHKMLVRRQEYVRHMLTALCQYQIDVKVSLGKLKKEFTLKDQWGRDTTTKIQAREAFDIKMPDVNVGDTRTAAVAFELVSRAVTLLRTQQVLPDKSAVEIINALAELLGVKLDIDEIVDELSKIPVIPTTGLVDDEEDPGGPGAGGQDLSQFGIGKDMLQKSQPRPGKEK